MDENKSKLIGDVKLPFRVLFKRTFKYLKPHLWKIILALLLIVLGLAFEIVVPLIYRDIIDNLNSNNIAIHLLPWAIVVYFSCTLVSQIIRFVDTIILQRVGNSVVYDMRVEIFEHIEKMSLDQFEVLPVGSLTTRVCNYTSQISYLICIQITNLRSIITNSSCE